MSNLRIWGRVPDGSVLRVGVVDEHGGAAQPFIARARIVHADGSETLWDDDDLRPGPKSLNLRRGDVQCVVRVWVGFAGKGVARVRALIRRPDGQIFGSPYQYSMPGKNGDVHRATLVVVMRKS